MDCPLDRWRHDPVFRSQPKPTLLLRLDCTIAAVSRAYLPLTGLSEDELIGVNVFDAFPERAGQAELGSMRAFADSFERALRTGRPHRLHALRYDIEDRRAPGSFVRKSWSVVNSPVKDGGLLGVMSQIDEVTLLSEDVITALRSQREGRAENGWDANEHGEGLETVMAAIEQYGDIATEVAQLRHALRSRPTIEQAKGIIMSDRKCGADEAFELLRQLSNDTNVRVAEVAAAVVYQRTHRVGGAA